MSPTSSLVVTPVVRVDLLVGRAKLRETIILSTRTWEAPIFRRLELPRCELKLISTPLMCPMGAWSVDEYASCLVPAKCAGESDFPITSGSRVRLRPVSDIYQSVLINTNITYYCSSSSSFASSKCSTHVRWDPHRWIRLPKHTPRTATTQEVSIGLTIPMETLPLGGRPAQGLPGFHLHTVASIVWWSPDRVN